MTSDWKGRETFLTFDGVSSAYYVWVNRVKVGYSQGSRKSENVNPHNGLIDSINNVSYIQQNGETYTKCRLVLNPVS